MTKKTLRQIRRMRDITQEEMASAMHVAPSTYLRWENCPAKIQIGKLLQICEILSCSIMDIKIFLKGNGVYVESEGRRNEKDY